MNATKHLLNRCVFNLDLNRESVSEPRTLSGVIFQVDAADWWSLRRIPTSM